MSEAPAQQQDDVMRLKALHRLIAIKKAKQSLLEFTKLTMPDPVDEGDAKKTRYATCPHHELIASALEEVESGFCTRLIITVPPRHGKSELASKRFPAWYMGRNPVDSMILATYSDDFAKDFGRKVREIMRMPAYKQVFPHVEFAGGSAAADRIELDKQGMAAFVGAGGAITGRGADLLLIDDPIKNSEDASSQRERDKQWEWFNTTAMSRLHGDSARVVIIQTRWHEDDLIGRLTDPKNDYYQASEAAKWKVIDLPALAEEDDILGRKPGEALWPEKYSAEFLEEAKVRDPRTFSALYQCRPAPADGIYFLKKWIKTYKPGELPSNLKKYCASDHAVATKQNNDFTVLMPFGVDEDDNIWILPDTFRGKILPDRAVEMMVEMMREHKPVCWYAERGHISKSIKPFLDKRMQEEDVYCYVDEVVPNGDKEARAQSIRGRVSMGKVLFPDFVPWFSDALDEMLKFPAGKKDDFVDCLSMVGLGMSRHITASKPKKKKAGFESGTMGWIKQQYKRTAHLASIAKYRGF